MQLPCTGCYRHVIRRSSTPGACLHALSTGMQVRPVGMQASKRRDVDVKIQFLIGNAGQQLAYERKPPRQGGLPAILFCNGLLSDRSGRKAATIKEVAAQLGCECVLFDYQAHGSSPGALEQLGPADWLDDATSVLDQAISTCRVVVVGSSLGGWIALLLAHLRPQRVQSLLLLAPAIDISEYHWRSLSQSDKLTAWQTGRVALQSPYVHTSLSSSSLMTSTPAVQETAEQEPSSGSGQGSGQDAVSSSEEVCSLSKPAREPSIAQGSGAIMLGLPFFEQGSRLMLLHATSQLFKDAQQEGQGYAQSYNTQSVLPDMFDMNRLRCMPVVVVQGDADDCVPCTIALHLMHKLCGLDGRAPETVQELACQARCDIQGQVLHVEDSVCQVLGCAVGRNRLFVVVNGDHRLSCPADLAFLREELTSLMKE